MGSLTFVSYKTGKITKSKPGARVSKSRHCLQLYSGNSYNDPGVLALALPLNNYQ